MSLQIMMTLFKRYLDNAVSTISCVYELCRNEGKLGRKNPYFSHIFLSRNFRLLLMSAAYIQLHSRLLLSLKQTVGTLIRLILREHLIWVHIVCNVCYKSISADEKSR